MHFAFNSLAVIARFTRPVYSEFIQVYSKFEVVFSQIRDVAIEEEGDAGSNDK